MTYSYKDGDQAVTEAPKEIRIRHERKKARMSRGDYAGRYLDGASDCPSVRRGALPSDEKYLPVPRLSFISCLLLSSGRLMLPSTREELPA